MPPPPFFLACRAEAACRGIRLPWVAGDEEVVVAGASLPQQGERGPPARGQA